MRNPFKTVYCEDCEHCVLATKYSDKESQIGFAKCHAKPKKPTRNYAIRPVKKSGIEYWYCSSRMSEYCFRFKQVKSAISTAERKD